MGPLGLRPEEFWSMTWANFYRLCEANKIREERQWEHTRYIACVLVNIHRDPKKPAIKPSDLVPLSGDKKPKGEVKELKTYYTKEELRALKIKHGILKADG